MKKPFLKWLVMKATIITPTTPAAASGLSRPRMSMTPAPSSVRLASPAWRMPGLGRGGAGRGGGGDAGLEPHALEPAGGALDLAATPDVVVAVGDHRDAE